MSMAAGIPLVPQSLSSILIHLIFSTKHREPLITPHIEPDLHAYLGGIARQKRCPALAIGGMPDHVHVLVSLTSTASVSGIVKALKADSSRWIKDQGVRYRVSLAGRIWGVLDWPIGCRGVEAVYRESARAS